MTQFKHTAPNKMSVEAMIVEHRHFDELVSGHAPKIDALENLGFTLSAAKVRRCGLKTAIQGQAMRGDQDAIAYSKKRKWQACSTKSNA